MEDNTKKFDANNANVNNEQQAQVENKKTVLETVKAVITNKYTLISLGAAAISFCGYKGYKFWKARKAEKNQEAEDKFEDVTEK